MAEEKSPDQAKSLEMRVAELEDQLKKIYITEEELKAYRKVSALLGASSPGMTPSLWPKIIWLGPGIRWQQSPQSGQIVGGYAPGPGDTISGGFGDLGN
jgi:hypothetical protein